MSGVLTSAPRLIRRDEESWDSDLGQEAVVGQKMDRRLDLKKRKKSLLLPEITPIGNDDDGNAGAQQSRPKRKPPKNRSNKTTIVFDTEARKEYLTGFRKRKEERRHRAQEKAQNRLKQEVRKARCVWCHVIRLKPLLQLRGFQGSCQEEVL